MEKHPKRVFEYNQITENIYIGTNLCCLTHFKQELIDAGIRADISLEEKKIDAPFGVEYYLWLPVKDHFYPTFRQFDVGTKFINELVKSGEKVYIHCKNGHGRAPTLVAAYLALYEKKSPEEALKLIEEKRPATHPNDAQMAAIKDFVEKINLRNAIL